MIRLPGALPGHYSPAGSWACPNAEGDQHPDEIDELVAENRRPIEELRSLYPFIELAEKP